MIKINKKLKRKNYFFRYNNNFLKKIKINKLFFKKNILKKNKQNLSLYKLNKKLLKLNKIKYKVFNILIKKKKIYLKFFTNLEYYNQLYTKNNFFNKEYFLARDKYSYRKISYNFKKIKINKFLLKEFLIKLICFFTKKGKKTFIEVIIYKIITKLNLKFKNKGFKILYFSFLKLMPVLGLDLYRLKKEKKYRPIIIKKSTAINYAIKWFYLALQERKDFYSLYDKMYFEILDIIKNKGLSLNKKKAHYKMIISQIYVLKYYPYKLYD